MDRDQAMAVLALAEAARAAKAGSGGSSGSSGSDPAAAQALRDAADRIAPAIEFLIGTDHGAALRLVGALAAYWPHAGRLAEGRTLTDRAIRASDPVRDTASAATIAGALLAAAELAFRQGDLEEAKTRANDCIRAAGLVGDTATLALARTLRAKVDGPAASTPACDCCADSRIASRFDRLTAERTEGGTVLPEMMPVTRLLYAQLDDVGAARPTILELGCGSAALLVTLLTDGATSGDGIDLSPAAIATAERRAAAADVADRAHFSVGDAAQSSQAAHDWVVLDRSICCYPDMPRLVGAALSAGPRRVAFSVPTSRGVPGVFNKLSWGFESFLTRFRKGECPGYVHDVNDIERRLAGAGFRRTSVNASTLWYTAVWDRA